MAKDDEEELEEEEKDASFVCNIAGYDIFADKYQYIVFCPKGKAKTPIKLGFFGTLTSAISDIRQTEMRNKTLKSRTLEIVIDKLVEFDREFNKLLLPLKKLEDK
jgi:hypothetical protein